MDKNTFLVTGGLGFIGSHVVEDLLIATGNQHIVIVDFNRQSPNIPLFEHEPRVTILFEDITSPEEELYAALEPYAQNIHTVIHLAAAISVEESVSDPQKYHRTNVEGSATIFKWCIQNHIQAVVSASSAAVYGTPKSLPCKEEDVTPSSTFLSPYAETKYQMELEARSLVEKRGAENGTSFVFLRFFNVYGPRQDPKNPYTGVISKFMDFAMEGSPITIFGDGLQTRDFIFVKDISAAIQRSAEKASELGPVSVFNVCTGKSCSIKELAAYCIRLPGSRSEGVEYRTERAGDIKHSFGSNDALCHEVGWDYRHTLADGLDKTWIWFQKQQNERKRAGGKEELAPGTEVSARAGVGID